uniref:Transmembrane protein n=1 Tax=Neospora caninum (strain Liverpool) TaxID=572307 RepID=A0A0F7UKT8_NEOCL|nr:TPA: hypothetical protein BN1204_045175 [Neospora caninum Liverpool]
MRDVRISAFSQAEGSKQQSEERREKGKKRHRSLAFCAVSSSTKMKKKQEFTRVGHPCTPSRETSASVEPASFPCHPHFAPSFPVSSEAPSSSLFSFLSSSSLASPSFSPLSPHYSFAPSFDVRACSSFSVSSSAKRKRSLSWKRSRVAFLSLPFLSLFLAFFLSLFLSLGDSTPVNGAISPLLAQFFPPLSVSSSSSLSCSVSLANAVFPQAAASSVPKRHRQTTARTGKETKDRLPGSSRLAFVSPVCQCLPSARSSSSSAAFPSSFSPSFPPCSSSALGIPISSRAGRVSRLISSGAPLPSGPSASFSLASLPFSSLLFSREFLFSPSLCKPPSLAHAVHRRAQLLLHLRDQGHFMGLRGRRNLQAALTFFGASLGAFLIWRGLYALSAFFSKQQKRQQMEEVSLYGHYEDPTLAREAAETVRRARETPPETAEDTAAVFRRIQALAESSEKQVVSPRAGKETERPEAWRDAQGAQVTERRGEKKEITKVAETRRSVTHTPASRGTEKKTESVSVVKDVASRGPREREEKKQGQTARTSATRQRGAPARATEASDLKKKRR